MVMRGRSARKSTHEHPWGSNRQPDEEMRLFSGWLLHKYRSSRAPRKNHSIETYQATAMHYKVDDKIEVS